jgi:hypothetical protein
MPVKGASGVSVCIGKFPYVFQEKLKTRRSSFAASGGRSALSSIFPFIVRGKSRKAGIIKKTGHGKVP